MFYDRKQDAALQQVAEQAAAEGAGGLGGDLGGGALGGDLGGDPGGDLGGGPAEMPAGDAGPLGGAEEPAGGEAAGGDDSPLLAVPPGSRNEPRLHGGPNSKSKKVYYPKKVDRRDAGAQRRSTHAQYNREKGSSTTRNILPGMEINSLAGLSENTNSIYEGQEPIYKTGDLNEEEKLFSVTKTMEHLIRELESAEQTNESKT